MALSENTNMYIVITSCPIVHSSILISAHLSLVISIKCLFTRDGTLYYFLFKPWNGQMLGVAFNGVLISKDSQLMSATAVYAIIRLTLAHSKGLCAVTLLRRMSSTPGLHCGLFSLLKDARYHAHGHRLHISTQAHPAECGMGLCLCWSTISNPPEQWISERQTKEALKHC